MAEDKAVTEKPTMDEGAKPDEKKEPNDPKETAAKMLETLESLNIKDEDHIRDLVKTASYAGKSNQELGQVRQMLEELRQENESLRAMKTQSMNTDDLYGSEDNIDLAKLIYENQVKANRDFYNKEILEPQKKLQTQYFTELNEVQGDEDYSLVEKTFTEHINSPQVQARIASGQTSVAKEYDKVVRSTYRNYLKQTQDALKGVVTPETTKVPHVESQTQQPVMPTTDEEKEEHKKKIIEARKKGDITPDQAVELITKLNLGIDPKDPFFQMG